ncbi:MAG TPA: TlyA family RNA methyltransferase [Nitrospinota bacterium]|nr:TlyA family RNA methyltransferase [Nitrospinota bacterium]
MQGKERLDKVLVEKGLAEGRERAKALILAGKVFVDGTIINKAGTKVSSSSNIKIKQNSSSYVSRGGEKLEGFFKAFPLDLKDKIAMDIGASTGGFTHFLLERGVKKVYAIDVGYGQLDWHLRNDPRVINMEKVNIRYLDPSMIKDRINLATIDVSFISLELVLPLVFRLLAQNGEVIALIKPQFEVGKEEVEKKGIIRDKTKHKKVLLKIAQLSKKMGWKVKGMMRSPLLGAKGNIEFFIYLSSSKDSSDREDIETYIDNIINNPL